VHSFVVLEFLLELNVDGDVCAEMSASRDSLLVAMTTAMWCSRDTEVVEMVRRLVYVAMTQQQQEAGSAVGRLAERCRADQLIVDQSDAIVAHLSTRQSNDVTRVNSAQVSQHHQTTHIAQMYLWTRKSSLNFRNHPDLDTYAGFLTDFLPLLSRAILRDTGSFLP